MNRLWESLSWKSIPLMATGSLLPDGILSAEKLPNPLYHEITIQRTRYVWRERRMPPIIFLRDPEPLDPSFDGELWNPPMDIKLPQTNPIPECDMDSLINLGETCETTKCCDATPTMVDTLTQKKLRLENQLADVNAAIAALQSQPGITGVLELIRKVNRY